MNKWQDDLRIAQHGPAREVANPMEFRGDYLFGRESAGRFPVYLRRDDFSHTIGLLVGEPGTGKTRTERRLMGNQLNDPQGPLIVAIETAKDDHLDLVLRPDFLYLDHNSPLNPTCIGRSSTPESILSDVADIKADTLGLVHATGAHILINKAAVRLHHRDKFVNEESLRAELVAMYVRKEYRADQRNSLANAIDRCEYLCGQLGPALCVNDNHLLRALHAGKHVYVNLTGRQGPAQVYLAHIQLLCIYQFCVEMTLKAGQDATRPRVVVYIDEAGAILSRGAEKYGHQPLVSRLLQTGRRYGFVVVCGTQQPDSLLSTVLSVSWKAIFRISDAANLQLVARSVSLSKEQQDAISTLPNRRCILALGRSKPVFVDVADTPIQPVPEAVRSEFLGKKSEFSVRYLEANIPRLAQVSAIADSAISTSASAPQSKPPQADLSPDALKVLSFIANDRLWLGREATCKTLGLSPARFKVAIDALNQAALITQLHVRVKAVGRPRLIDYLSIDGWVHVGKDPSQNRMHTLLRNQEMVRIAKRGLIAKAEYTNRLARHDVVGLDRQGRIVTVSEIVLSPHRRVRAQLEAAVSAGAKRIYLVVCDGPDVRRIQNLLTSTSEGARQLTEVVPVRELLFSDAEDDGKKNGGFPQL